MRSAMILEVPTPSFGFFQRKAEAVRLLQISGRVTQVVGLVVECNGPTSRVGDLCLIESGQGEPIQAEVVGFRGDRVLLMPLGELSGVRAGCLVHSTGGCLKVPAGASLLGRTLDGLGRPIDGLGPIDPEARYPTHANPPNALERKLIER
ncbi:MAG TPA: hypothetical protein VM328_13365, partial [Fimbriimonadaceae bacterium]|nr:hypothetical protein [Fimbriimonadaceae bacterium]